MCDVTACASCHGDPARRDELMAGVEIPLSGGFVWDIPPGGFDAPNITPDDETGLGRISDQAIDSRAALPGSGTPGRPCMPFDGATQGFPTMSAHPPGRLPSPLLDLPSGTAAPPIATPSLAETS